MAQTGFTPIVLFHSATTTNAPTAGNLAAGELALNTADGFLFYKDDANAIQKIGYKLTPVTAGGTGLATLTANNVMLGNGTSTPGFVAPSTSGNVLTSNGTTWASTAPAVGLTQAKAYGIALIFGF